MMGRESPRAAVNSRGHDTESRRLPMYFYTTTSTRKARPLAERFWCKVDKNGPIPAHRPDLGPCWLWIGAIFRTTGYGQFERSTAHRWAWFLTYGEEPLLPQLDHLCRVKRCCRPS